MYVQSQLSVNFEGIHEMIQVATKLADELSVYIGEIDGLYVIGTELSHKEAIQFWKNALEISPAFVTPALFPQTLANALSFQIANAFKIHGPCHTILYTDDCPGLVHSLISSDLKKQIIKQALLVLVSRSNEQALCYILGSEPKPGIFEHYLPNVDEFIKFCYFN